jgi:hypothetical protein
MPEKSTAAQSWTVIMTPLSPKPGNLQDYSIVTVGTPETIDSLPPLSLRYLIPRRSSLSVP